ncbi:BTB/POZ domain-containing protein [Rhizophagus irregularis DAOM 181602=DAOM 197198]|uniref:Uncharacterized protein n=1 Tax=Rhizophagus irregularis (strain DAOM 181602 / DAOM 197198 / MUCL 43194) TaxID=747089 RepID=A0A2P4P583_RHIID|nr:hypothetical protein GLOIN_2v1787739 [Rhizophagus irregularis DAOM 181602=DAOM 197198]POG60550.1 hypothetical protein GLOIN_2v1787739 [Rhizophagus irregularis DAOM 181602=DAOM 197198]GET65663.1 BTB/POZ domain-containing protein [Rhizophagus irregularis DAOM 181602=DAOM 197198]|eukprot:XP_025167416.1 hypothetical protein GLOIN_2v1787739 [Rhizophagus irregularis DAOM 181602=DAOM 197198]
MNNIYLYADYIDITDKIGTELLNIIIASDELNLENLTRKFNKFTQLSGQLLEIILKREDLNIEENENLGNMIVKWDWHKNIILVEIFYDISPKVYMIKIKPYEEILSKEYRNDLLNYYMIPEYKPNLNNLASRYLKDINSVIIDQRHVTNWIDRNEERKFSLYKFNLLYRASRDGIIGGYNPLELNSTNGSSKRTKGSFLFSFTNKKNVQTAKTSYPDDNPCSYPKLDGTQ